jgi:broad specificity phosphatase PhoE
MRVFLVRHGQSLANGKGVHNTHDDALSPLGEQQVALLAERFKNVPLDRAIVSTMRRAQQTMEAVRKFHPQVPVTEDARLE